METAKYWYTAFKLTQNPFRFFEASMEESVDGIPFIETAMQRRVEALIKSGTSCIIKGIRGCGKSRLIQMLEGEEIFKVVTPENLDNVQFQIFLNIDIEKEEKYAEILWGRQVLRAVGSGENCKLCRKHCRISVKVRPVSEFIMYLRRPSDGCPARRTLLEKIIKNELYGYLFLMDVPDNLAGKEVENFASLCNMLLGNSNVVIVFATPEQASLLRRMDTFARFPIINFEVPNKSFFKQLFTQRIEGFREGEAALPFKEEVVEKLAEISHYNARNFIQLCSSVLTQMWLEGLTEPCDLDFLDKLDIIDVEKMPSEMDGIVEVLAPYKGEWVQLEELCRKLQVHLSIKFTERKATQCLKNLGFTLRRVRDGKTEAFITPSILEALQKLKS
jgi:energy-coupling factor transporter ATP-binding protein EcfA2